MRQRKMKESQINDDFNHCVHTNRYDFDILDQFQKYIIWSK